MTDGEWTTLIRDAIGRRPPPIRAIGYLGEPPVLHSPVVRDPTPRLVACDDGREWWVKYPLATNGLSVRNVLRLRSIIADHVVGNLARLLAPDVVPPVACVWIGEELRMAESRLQGAKAGPAHASQKISDRVVEVKPITRYGYLDSRANRTRFASLAVLDGMVSMTDYQVLYDLDGCHDTPSTRSPLVYTVDFGHAFEVEGDPSEATIDPAIVELCELKPDELGEPFRRLAELTPDAVAAAVAAPPDEWSFAEVDRIEIASSLWKRREAILRAGPPKAGGRSPIVNRYGSRPPGTAGILAGMRGWRSSQLRPGC